MSYYLILIYTLNNLCKRSNQWLTSYVIKKSSIIDKNIFLYQTMIISGNICCILNQLYPTVCRSCQNISMTFIKILHTCFRDYCLLENQTNMIKTLRLQLVPVMFPGIGTCVGWLPTFSSLWDTVHPKNIRYEHKWEKTNENTYKNIESNEVLSYRYDKNYHIHT